MLSAIGTVLLGAACTAAFMLLVGCLAITCDALGRWWSGRPCSRWGVWTYLEAARQWLGVAFMLACWALLFFVVGAWATDGLAAAGRYFSR